MYVYLAAGDTLHNATPGSRNIVELVGISQNHLLVF